MTEDRHDLDILIESAWYSAHVASESAERFRDAVVRTIFRPQGRQRIWNRSAIDSDRRHQATEALRLLADCTLDLAELSRRRLRAHFTRLPTKTQIKQFQRTLATYADQLGLNTERLHEAARIRASETILTPIVVEALTSISATSREICDSIAALELSPNDLGIVYKSRARLDLASRLIANAQNQTGDETALTLRETTKISNKAAEPAAGARYVPNSNLEEVIRWIVALLPFLALFQLVNSIQQSNNPVLLTLTAGAAGASSASIADLLQKRSTSVFEGLLNLLVVLLAGFAAGSFSLVLALTVADGSQTNSWSAVLLGGIYGLLFGGWASRLKSAPLVARSDAAVQEALPIARPLQPPYANYNGVLSVEFHDPANLDVVAAVMRLVFEGGAALSRPNDGIDLLANSQALILVSDGEDADHAVFLVTVIPPRDYGVFPQSRAISAPIEGRSSIFEFSVIRNDNDVDTRLRRSLLLDISQAGRTIHLMEVAIPSRGRGEIEP